MTPAGTPLVTLGPGGDYRHNAYPGAARQLSWSCGDGPPIREQRIMQTTQDSAIITWPVPPNTAQDLVSAGAEQAGAIPLRLFAARAEMVLACNAYEHLGLPLAIQFSPLLDVVTAPDEDWWWMVRYVRMRLETLGELPIAAVAIDQERGRPGLLSGAERAACTRRGYCLFGAIQQACPEARVIAYRYGESTHYTGEEAPPAVIRRCVRLYHHQPGLNESYLRVALAQADVVDVYVSIGCGYHLDPQSKTHTWRMGREQWPDLPSLSVATGALIAQHRQRIGAICTYPSALDPRLGEGFGLECWDALRKGIAQ